MSANPFEIDSIEDLDLLSADEINQIHAEAELYILESDHYQLTDLDIEHLENVIEMIKCKLSGKNINEKYETITTEELVNETFKEVFEYDFKNTMFPWFTLIRYKNKTKKYIVNEVAEEYMTFESFLVSEDLDNKIKKEIDEIESYTLCYEGEIDVDGQYYTAATVEFGVKGNEHSQNYYQRYSYDDGLILIDKKPIKYLKTPLRFSK